MAQLLGHLFSASLLDRRSAALLESASLMTGLFDEEHMKTAKKELETEVVTRSLMRPTVSQFRKQHHPQPPRQKQGGNGKSSAPSRPKQAPPPSGSPNQPTDRQAKTVTPRAFEHSDPKGNFPQGRMLLGKKK